MDTEDNQATEVMSDEEIIKVLNLGLKILLSEDKWLLENNISERSISHKLAEHLQGLFKAFNVDCEYNGSVGQPNEKKKITILKEQLANLGLLNKDEKADEETDTTQRSVFPDIIVHSRRTQESNICVIEIKKDTSTISNEYDFIKLNAYTSNDFGNSLNYQLGIFIEFITGEKPNYKLTFIKNGKKQ